jgi:RNA polymerase sigma-70 factor (ECF subfamily)
MNLRDPLDSVPAQIAPPSWLAGCRAGEPAAIGAMFREMLPTVERTLGRIVGPTPDFEDLVQNTFAEAMRALPRFRGDASFKTWITSIAVHTAQHHFRAGKVRRHVALELVPEERFARVEDRDAEQALDERRLGPALYALLDRISPPKRVALLLFAVEGRSVEEVAALMGASQTATRSRVFFARRELRALIAQDPRLCTLAEAMFGGTRKEEQP